MMAVAAEVKVKLTDLRKSVQFLRDDQTVVVRFSITAQLTKGSFGSEDGFGCTMISCVVVASLSTMLLS
jgi:hypothetical protein